MAAIAPDPDDLDRSEFEIIGWIPGVTCYREAQDIAAAIAHDPQDLLPPCPKSSSCYTEKGYVCKLVINHPF